MPEDTAQTLDLQTRIQQSFQGTLQQFADHAPQILGALFLLLAGWIAAWILKLLTGKLLNGINALLGHFPQTGEHEPIRIRSVYTKIVCNIVYWTVLALFFVASANALGWTLLTDWLSNIVRFLPQLISGLLIVLVGVLLGNIAKSAVTAAATRSQINRAGAIGRFTQIGVVFGFAVMGIEQIGLNLQFLTDVFVVVLGALIAGAALSFGLGSRDLVANLIGAQRFRRHCNTGEYLKIGDSEGEIVELTQTSIILDTKTGRTIVPAKRFLESSSQLFDPDGSNQDSASDGKEDEYA